MLGERLGEVAFGFTVAVATAYLGLITGVLLVFVSVSIASLCQMARTQ